MLRLMRMLLIAGCVCIAALLWTQVALWRRTRADNAASREKAKATRMETARRAHPREDFAAGVVGREQNVNRRGRVLRPELPPVAETGKPVRNDWAHFNKDLGDLSDPDLRPGSGRRPA